MRPAGAFNGIGNANTAQFAARLGLSTARFKAGPIGGLQRHRHILWEIAAIISIIKPSAERHRVRRDQVLLTQRNAVNAHFIRGKVNDAFNGVNRLRPPGATIGRSWLGMRENAAHFSEDMRCAINAREPADIIGR